MDALNGKGKLSDTVSDKFVFDIDLDSLTGIAHILNEFDLIGAVLIQMTVRAM